MKQRPNRRNSQPPNRRFGLTTRSGSGHDDRAGSSRLSVRLTGDSVLAHAKRRAKVPRGDSMVSACDYQAK